MAGSSLTSSLIVRLVDQVTGPARKVSSSLLGIDRAAGGNFGARLGAATERNTAAMGSMRGKLFDAAAGFYILKNAIGGPVKAAMDFESAMADVRKVVDFASPDSFRQFQADLVALSKEVPVSVAGLTEIAAAAGQAGYAEADLLKVTRAAAMLGVAFDISAEKARDAIPQLQNSLGMTLPEVMSLADAINHLSNAQASSAADILDVVTKNGSYAQAAGFSAEETAALASAMLSTGQQTEVVGTTVRNLARYLTTGASATKRQKNAFTALGLEAEDVAKNMQIDAMGTFADILDRINNAPAHQRGSLISGVFGNEARAIGPLVNNLKLLPESIAMVASESEYAGSALNEFEVRSKTFANTVELMQNRLSALKITIGNALIPVLSDMIAAISPVIDKLAALADAHPDVIRNVAMAAAGVIAFKVAVAALSFVGLLGRGGALSLLALGFNTVGKASIGASRGAKGMLAYQSALAAMDGKKLGGLSKVGAALKGMALALPGVSGIGSALGAIGAALGAVSLPVLGLIAAGVAAVAGAGVLIWKYWDRLSSIFGGVAARLSEELSPSISVVQPHLDNLAAAGQMIGDAFGVAMTKLQEFGSWIGSFFQQEVLNDEEKAAFGQAGYDVADRMINAIKSKIAELVEWFKGVPARIVEAIGTIDIGANIRANILPQAGQTYDTPKGQLTMFDRSPPSGHRAAGGPAHAGGSFLVGENEPEIFSPKSGGTITPLSKLGGKSVTFGDFIFHGVGGDPAALKQAVKEALSSEVNKLLRGAHSDSEAWT